ncbi:MAG: hypothetical protein WA019_04080 [Candidatus Moraniibacteriota bacterium]
MKQLFNIKVYDVAGKVILDKEKCGEYGFNQQGIFYAVDKRENNDMGFSENALWTPQTAISRVEVARTVNFETKKEALEYFKSQK